jgi:hypothetical protein
VSTLELAFLLVIVGTCIAVGVCTDKWLHRPIDAEGERIAEETFIAARRRFRSRGPVFPVFARLRRSQNGLDLTCPRPQH